MYLCSMVSEPLSNYDRCQSLFFCVILIGDAIQANQCLVLAELKGCQVRDWIVRKCEFHEFKISRV